MTSFAVPQDLFNLYRDMDEALRRIDRFRLPAQLQARLESYVEYKLRAAKFSLSPGQLLHRARLFAFNQSDIHSPNEMGAPPASKSRGGRLNPEGLPLLYVADYPTTAISEMRPWVGAKLTVAAFTPSRVLSLVSLSIGVDAHHPILPHENDQGFLAALAMDLNHISNPAHPDDRLSYLPTQYIASVFRAHGIDGLSYSSALRAGGMNYALFDTNSCIYQSASVFEVNGVEISVRKAA